MTKSGKRLTLQISAVVVLFSVYSFLVYLYPKDFLQAYAALVLSTLTSIGSIVLREMKSVPDDPPAVVPPTDKELPK